MMLKELTFSIDVDKWWTLSKSVKIQTSSGTKSGVKN